MSIPLNSVNGRPRRRRCKNCLRYFDVRSKGGSPQRFCTEHCRKDFHRNGAALGKLRDKIPAYIAREVGKHFDAEFVTREYFLRVLRAMRFEYQKQFDELRSAIAAVRPVDLGRYTFRRRYTKAKKGARYMTEATRDEFEKLLGSLHLVHEDMANCRALVDMPRMKANADEHLLSMHRLLDNSDLAPGVSTSEIVDRLTRMQQTLDKIAAAAETVSAPGISTAAPAGATVIPITVPDAGSSPDSAASPAGDDAA